MLATLARGADMLVLRRRLPIDVIRAVPANYEELSCPLPVARQCW